MYPNLMKLDYDNRRTRNSAKLDLAEDLDQKSPLDLFEEFYRTQNGQDMTEEQRQFSAELMESIWEVNA